MARDTLAKLKRLHARAQAFLEEKGIELQEEWQLSPVHKFAHFWLLVVRSFLQNRCAVRASALAYTTLLGLIPLLAVVISVSTGLLKAQGEKPVQEFLDKLVSNVAPQLNLVTRTNQISKAEHPGEKEGSLQARQVVVRRITEYISNIRSGALGASGIVSLILVAILLLSNIEQTFNDIWGAPRGRGYFTRTVYYWAAITLGPLILLVAIGLTSGPHIETTKRFLVAMPIIGKWLLAMLPFLLLICGFALFYGLMPNTRVDWRAALVGGAVGGGLWQMNSMFSVIYVSRVVTYSKIYGSLSMVPVFLIGLYFSWLIMLFGAQVAYAFQNRKAYAQQIQAGNIHQSGREFIALRLMTGIAHRFYRGEKSLTASEMGAHLGITSHLIGEVLHNLARAGLLIEVAGTETAYAPAKPLDHITCQEILQAIRCGHGTDLPTRDEPARKVVREQLDQIRRAEEDVAGAVTLQALVERLS
ncbi:MAG: YihY family inner membrane protein [Candidatus Omnitrophica bacterium]|nr:YihY family inner membrane protein [Candidatus Omnitrophota bacterium]